MFYTEKEIVIERPESEYPDQYIGIKVGIEYTAQDYEYGADADGRRGEMRTDYLIKHWDILDSDIPSKDLTSTDIKNIEMELESVDLRWN